MKQTTKTAKTTTPNATTADPMLLEQNARAALEERYGRRLTDEEWATAKQRLRNYGMVLRDWEQKGKQT